MRFLPFFFLTLFPSLIFATDNLNSNNDTETGLWLRKINRQGKTVSPTRIEVIQPNITNIDLIARLIQSQTGSIGNSASNWLSSTETTERQNQSNSKSNFALFKKQNTGGYPNNNINHSAQNTGNTQQGGNFANTPGGSETILHLRGYCFFDRDIVVYGHLKMYATLPCAFEGISQTAEVFGELVPRLQNYSLIFVPKKVYIGGIPFKVQGGYALSGDGSTVNIANEVNDQAIKRILATAGVDAGEKSAKLIEKSAEGAQTEVNVNGDVVVKKTNFDIDIVGSSAFWTAIASLVKNTADYFKTQTDRIPITFKIYRGTKIYLDIDAKRIY
jgi:hypothetical protein